MTRNACEDAVNAVKKKQAGKQRQLRSGPNQSDPDKEDRTVADLANIPIREPRAIPENHTCRCGAAE